MNIAKTTEKYVEEHPSIRNCLKKNLINYSKLARLIAHDQNIDEKRFDAVLVACRRTVNKIRGIGLEEQTISQLKQIKLEARTKIITVTLRKNINYSNLADLKNKKDFHLIINSNAITIICLVDYLKDIKKLFSNKIIKVNKDLAEIRLKCPNMQNTFNYIISLISDQGVAILEMLSSGSEARLVINEQDMAKTMQILSF